MHDDDDYTPPCFGECKTLGSKDIKTEPMNVPGTFIPYVIFHDATCEAKPIIWHEEQRQRSLMDRAITDEMEFTEDAMEVVDKFNARRSWPAGASFFASETDLAEATACYPDGPSCDWSVEGRGHEEQTEYFEVCTVHGTVGPKVHPSEVEG